MSLRLEMLQVARLSPKLLSESIGLVKDFLLGQQLNDGGYQNRADQSDLYYTVFGLEGLTALQMDLPVEKVSKYLLPFGTGETLDFVHLSSLARCWANLHKNLTPSGLSDGILRKIEGYRTPDGGYNPVKGSLRGTVYGCFLALGTYQDLKTQIPDPDKLIQCVCSLKSKDGAFANMVNMPTGSTNATAAAVTLLRQFRYPVEDFVGQWLLDQCHPEGGFLAAPHAPLPDLLSTATALHALTGMQVSLESVKDPCLDFVDTLWTNKGGFYGHWAENILDCEYTYYGLLSLGHLSL